MTTTLEAPASAATTWQHLMRHVTDRAVTKFDLVVKPADLTIQPDGTLVAFDRPLQFNEIGLAQFARRIGVPATYLQKLYQHDKELFHRNASRWLHDGNTVPQDKEFLLRCDSNSYGDEYVRATLSDKYGILDDLTVVEAAYRAFEAAGLTDELTIEQAVTTQTSLHIRLSARGRAIQAVHAAGHITKAGQADLLFPMLHQSNSEVGLGSAKLESGVYRLLCLNGMVRQITPGGRFSKRHIGTGADLQALLIGATPGILESAVQFTQQFAESAQETHVTSELIRTLTDLLARERVSKADEKEILEQLGNGFTATTFDVVNAITATARPQTYDDRLALERIAAKVLTYLN